MLSNFQLVISEGITCVPYNIISIIGVHKNMLQIQFNFNVIMCAADFINII